MEFESYNQQIDVIRAIIKTLTIEEKEKLVMLTQKIEDLKLKQKALGS